MKKLKIKNLIDFLKDNKIDFELVLNGIDIEDDFTFASVKSIVKKGIFYLENVESLSKFEIKNTLK